MFRKIAIGFVIVAMIGVAAIFSSYSSWRSDRYKTLQSGSQIAETDVGRIEYVLKGEEGPVVLFLHGMPGGYDQAPDNRAGFRLLAPSRPGYLSTPIEVGRTPAEQAQAFAALLDSLGIESVVVMGVSGGGPSAISFAAMYPERTTALIAMQSISQPFPNEGEVSALMGSDILYWMMVSTLLRLQGPEGLVTIQIPDPSNQQLVHNDPSKLEQFTRLMWSVWPPSLRMTGWQNDMLQVNDLALPVREIRVPTLILHGTADAIVPFAQSQQLAQQIPEARFHEVDGGGHMMPISHREEIDSIVGAFLREHAD